ncbi:MAG: hypothetical protein M1829_000221 [Trizodia sp. TS-e1964]|nr:MAG: hypothetical protein M1829_000221 [Trizodia sp. TS-e1964]
MLPQIENAYSCFPGPIALSDFRTASLLRAINATIGTDKHTGQAVGVKAIWLHFIEWKSPQLLADGEEPQRKLLNSLLDYDGGPSTLFPEYQNLALSAASDLPKEVIGNTRMFYVVPRTGTISPWSSKATAIAKICGLDPAVLRLERGMLIAIDFDQDFPIDDQKTPFADLLSDRMTQNISTKRPDTSDIFKQDSPLPLATIPFDLKGSLAMETLQAANKSLGLALSLPEIEYLIYSYANHMDPARALTDIELFMFAQINSEHCRHKQFNAKWTIDNQEKPHSLFEMIKNTHIKNPKYTVSAYSDNAAVLAGVKGAFWAPHPPDNQWKHINEDIHFLAKVETHNHPTAVSPFPGAATGSGGEIRDEGAVGRGSKPKAGLSGFSVSDLQIPGHEQPWELQYERPSHIASSLDIMLEGPIGSAAFNNEFGRPCLGGYFRTLLAKVPINDHSEEVRGYHKPIMIAGGVGTVRPQHAIKRPETVLSGDSVYIIGGPAMLVGLGGGAASSVASGESSVELDFASVQRGNPEMQRRAQMVIDACASLGEGSPLNFIHDVGAGGLSNAIPELAHDADAGVVVELRSIPNADAGLSPLQIWCCEAQERYVVSVRQDQLDVFEAIATRERCSYANVGRLIKSPNTANRMVLTDKFGGPNPIDMPMSVLFSNRNINSNVVESRRLKLPDFDPSLSQYVPTIPTEQLLTEAVHRVLRLPAVASKSFLITIGDRTVGGLTTRDQMVGPWQVPVSDVAVTATALVAGIYTGVATAMGERPTLSLISPAASARIAVAESLMNMAAADILDGLWRIRLSANWMSAISHPGEGAALYEAVEAIGMGLCPELGLSIPVGKDSLSMKMKWTDQTSNEQKEVTAPLSVVITAFAPVADISKTWTPVLQRLESVGETVILFVDLALANRALGGSALAQVFGQVGNEAPDVRDVPLLKDFFDALQQLQESEIVLAYHDRSDGGLFTTLVEMMFAGRCGLDVMLDELSPSSGIADLIQTLFNEELGAVFQVRKTDETNFHRCFATCGPPPGLIKKIGRVPSASKQLITLRHGSEVVFSASRGDLQKTWASTSYQMQRLRDNPLCADAEYSSILNDIDPGLSYHLTYSPKENILSFTASITSTLTSKPRIAILREQGVNGHAEMAFAFQSAGFAAIDVHMTDLIDGRISLSSFTGLAACGGFSYGDVLGAGQGWAKSVLLRPKLRDEFEAFFNRDDTFSLGVCNGCQFLARLKELIPGAASWPSFERNISEQYEARVCMVSIQDNPEEPSVFLHGMAGSRLPIAVAHGEGCANFSDPAKLDELSANKLISMQYLDNTGAVTQEYPYNPNGSPLGIAGVRSLDGRVLALMPHPERTVLKDVCSYMPKDLAAELGEFGPWIRMFKSARRWVG